MVPPNGSAAVAGGKRRLEDQHETAQDAKRPRSNHGSPATTRPGEVGGGKVDAARLVADARAKAAAIAEKLKASKGGTATGLVPRTATQHGTTESAKPLSKVEEMRARVAALTGKNKSPAQTSSAFAPPSYDDDLGKARGGLSAALHPSLLETNRDSLTGKPSSGRTTVGRADDRDGKGKMRSSKAQMELVQPDLDKFRNQNPYFDNSLGGQTATLKTRHPKQIKFNERGKYVQQAASMRRLEALEAMRKRIAASARKALIEDDVAEKNFVVDAPPEIEWWDEGLVAHPEKGYEEIDSSGGLKIDSSDSIITNLIQHPVLIEPPSDRLMPAPKPMYLTTKEQKKIRRQRRMADLKETQAKVRLGLMEPPPDKVKLGNLMRVLGEEAVKDPTAVEARVNQQIAERKGQHLQMNEDRKLSKEEKHEKLEQKKEQDAAMGIYLTVYKINSLANGRHRFKISKNVEQLGGTGLCIFAPRFCLVLVEFGIHGARVYKKLMTNRIDWTENSPAPVRKGNKVAQAAFLNAEEEDGSVKDLSRNRCELLFEGQEKDRVFRAWRTRTCESDKEAMEILERSNMASFWTMAKSLP